MDEKEESSKTAIKVLTQACVDAFEVFFVDFEK